MLRFSIVWWLRGLAKSAPKNGSCKGSAAQDESDSEVKIVKNWQARSTFES